jgi:acyl-CoA synthetase (NDP forming)
MDVLAKLLRPRSVAVIGASADPTKTSGRPVSQLLTRSFPGAIYPVNPKVSRIASLKCHPNVSSLPAVPDAAIVLLGAERAHQAVRELAAIGTGAAIVLASGYGEVGEEGARRQQQLIEAAGSMRILGPNTIGLVNLTDGIVLSASGALETEHFAAGSIAVIAQSGGILGALLSRAGARGIGLSKLVATGNEADLELADFLDHMACDDATRVIALYIEAVRHPEKFRAAALKARGAGKPIIAFKVGRSEAGARAAISHSGALAGSDRMYDAFFKQLGIIRAQTFADLLDIATALATGRRLSGRRVAILTSTGGAGTLVADCLGAAGFDTPAPDMSTGTTLRALHGGGHAVMDRNPIDLTLAGLQPELLRGTMKALLASPVYDALTIIVGSMSLAMPDLLANAIADCLPLSDKPVIAYLSPHAPEIGAALISRGVPAFSAPESCAVVLAAMLEAQRECPPELRTPTDPKIKADDLPAGSMDESEAKALFARFGIPVVPEKIVSCPAEAQAAARTLGGRVVLKVLSRDISHKTEVGGVAIDVSAETASQRLLSMSDTVAVKTGMRPQRFTVQQMLEGGTELILGMHRDPLGTAILLGMGGITAELFNDTAMRLIPAEGWLTRDEALVMIHGLSCWPLLDGFRGRPKADVGALVEAIVAFSRMVAQLGERLLEAEINPLFVLPEGHGVRAADGLLVLRTADPSSP